MKKIAVLLVLIAFGAASAFAAGQVDGADDDWAARGYRGYDFPEETMTLTGTLNLTLSDHPELVVHGETWELMYPKYLAEGIEVDDRATVSVEGYEVPGPRFADESGQYLIVTKATINGTEYDISEYLGEGYGPMAGRGRSSSGYRSMRRPAPGGRGGSQQQGPRERW